MRIPVVPAIYEATGAVPCWTWRSGGALLAFSTRLGGVSAPPFDTLNLGRSTADLPAAVDENRRRFLRHLELDPQRLATAGQVHGTRVARVVEPGFTSDCDGLLTSEPGIPVAVSTADCMPIGVVAGGALAVAHSGWRGTAAGMPVVALEAVCAAAGVAADQVQIVIGPCIRSCCYRVGPEVAERFPPAALRFQDGAWHVDLPGAAQLALVEAGVLLENLMDVGECTACRPERYYSHRRDRGITGRHWAVAAWQ